MELGTKFFVPDNYAPYAMNLNLKMSKGGFTRNFLQVERSKVELNEVEESVVKLKKVERSGAEVLFTHFMSSKAELK